MCFHGNNINKVFNAIANPEDEYNKLIPMPPSLDVESGTWSSYAYAYYMIKKFNRLPDDFRLERDEVIAYVEKDITKSSAEAFNLGKQIKENKDKYGDMTWYYWCINNWGTKWNAHEVYRGGSELQFQTAWAFPKPVIEQLAELAAKYGVSFKGKYADEDMGSNTGEFYTDSSGILEVIEFPCGSSSAYEAYIEYWGEDNCIGIDSMVNIITTNVTIPVLTTKIFMEVNRGL